MNKVREDLRIDIKNIYVMEYAGFDEYDDYFICGDFDDLYESTDLEPKMLIVNKFKNRAFYISDNKVTNDVWLKYHLVDDKHCKQLSKFLDSYWNIKGYRQACQNFKNNIDAENKVSIKELKEFENTLKSVCAPDYKEITELCK